jgi:hypothetical protein
LNVVDAPMAVLLDEIEEHVVGFIEVLEDGANLRSVRVFRDE